MQGQETLAGHGIVVARAGSTAMDQTTFVVTAGSPARVEGQPAAYGDGGVSRPCSD